MFRVKRQHLCRRQIFRIKISLPLRVLKTRRADPKFHVNSSSQESLSKIAVQAPFQKPFDASSQQSAFESNMAASSCPAPDENRNTGDLLPQQLKQEREIMKKMLLSMALAVVAPFAWAQVSETTTTTTTTEGNGTITEYTPGSAIVLKETTGPRRYRFGKTVTYVTRSGKVLDEETVRTKVKVGVPVRVHYVGTGDNMMVDRVILDED